MFRSAKAIAVALIAVTVAGTTLSTATEADAHPLLAIGLAAGALGVAVGSAIAHESQPVVVARGPGDHCTVRQHYQLVGQGAGRRGLQVSVEAG